MRVITLIVFLVFSLLNFTSNQAEATNTPKKFALLIGIADYSGASRLSSLDGTLNDIDLTKQLLLQKRFGFEEKNITVLKDKDATHSGIEKAMQNLAALVKKEGGGIVYIHYSGHGSYTRNLNKKEKEDFDQTWVSYGARNELSEGIDKWDILDDEIREWRLNIADYADQVILVSDSCHSGSITRGTHPAKTRGALQDDRTHPLAQKSFREDEQESAGLFIGAAKDTEQAGEYEPGNTSYGLFTWFWIQSLDSSYPGETWHDILRKTRIQVQGKRVVQTPQISGLLIDATIFSGSVSARERHYPVLEASINGKTVSIDHGAITGATVGSIYKLYNPNTEQDILPRLKLSSCTPFTCTGDVLNGTFNEATDLVIEEKHVITVEPIDFCIDGDFPKATDSTVANLNQAFSKNPIAGYNLVSPREPHTLTLFVTHPVRNTDGSITIKDNEVLPVSDQNAEAEVWILDSTNHLWHEQLKISGQDKTNDWQELRGLLSKISRAKEIKRLVSDYPPELDIMVSTWKKDSTCISGDDCFKDRTGTYRMEKAFSLNELEQQQLLEGDSLTFVIKNNGESSLYIYLLNIGPDDNIAVLFPRRGSSNDEDAKLNRGGIETIDTKRVGRLVLSSGNETFKVIASEKPLAVSYFNQKSYTRSGQLKKIKGTTRGSNNPFSSVIAAAIGGGTRGAQVMVDPVVSEWGTIQMSVDVQAR